MPPANAAAHAEPDDWLHDVGTSSHSRGSIFTLRGLYNLGCLAVLVVALFMLFAGYPIITVLSDRLLKSNGAFNLGGVNGTGQVPSTVGNFGLIDNDTPQEALTRTGIGGANEGVEYELVFSDEFEQDGRTFWPGDDPYWCVFRSSFSICPLSLTHKLTPHHNQQGGAFISAVSLFFLFFTDFLFTD